MKVNIYYQSRICALPGAALATTSCRKGKRAGRGSAPISKPSQRQVADRKTPEHEGRSLLGGSPARHVPTYEARQVAGHQRRSDHRLAHRGLLLQVVDHDALE